MLGAGPLDTMSGGYVSNTHPLNIHYLSDDIYVPELSPAMAMALPPPPSLPPTLPQVYARPRLQTAPRDPEKQ